MVSFPSQHLPAGLTTGSFRLCTSLLLGIRESRQSWVSGAIGITIGLVAVESRNHASGHVAKCGGWENRPSDADYGVPSYSPPGIGSLWLGSTSFLTGWLTPLLGLILHRLVIGCYGDKGNCLGPWEAFPSSPLCPCPVLGTGGVAFHGFPCPLLSGITPTCVLREDSGVIFCLMISSVGQ